MTSEQRKTDLDTVTPKDVTRVMLRTLFSTTWRIFLPVTILFLVGLAVDLNVPTKPWGMAVGTSLGIIVAVILVMHQLRDIRKHPLYVNSTKGAK